jgi:hypothetical protein
MNTKIASNLRRKTVGITFDPALIELASEFLPNRSRHAEQGVLRAVLEKIKSLRPAEQKRHLKKIAHMQLIPLHFPASPPTSPPTSTPTSTPTSPPDTMSDTGQSGQSGQSGVFNN